MSREWSITSGMREKYVTEGYLGACRLSLWLLNVGERFEKHKWPEGSKGVSGSVYQDSLLPGHV